MENSRENIRYIDNPDNGVTVAIMGETGKMPKLDAIRTLENLVENNSRFLELRGLFDPSMDRLLMKNTYKGVSKCNMTEDTYDREEGRRYARRRCQEKYDNAKNKRLIEFLIDLWKLTEAIENYLITHGILEYCDAEECCGDCDVCENN